MNPQCAFPLLHSRLEQPLDSFSANFVFVFIKINPNRKLIIFILRKKEKHKHKYRKGIPGSIEEGHRRRDESVLVGANLGFQNEKS